MEYSYDSLGRTVGVCYNGVEEVRYVYSLNGNVSITKDIDNNREYRYYYDNSGRLLNERATVNGVNDYNRFYTYDEYGRLIKKSTLSEHSKSSVLNVESYTYDANGNISSIDFGSNRKNYYDYDEWGRYRCVTVYNSQRDVALQKGYTYYTTTNSLRTRIKSVDELYIPGASSDVINDTTNYSYDSIGNIRVINRLGGFQIVYTYDSSNQLIREDNGKLGYTYTYTYDASGNILEKKKYAFTIASTLSSPLDTITYGYDNAGWGDQLTSYDGQSITYDGAGNPLSYYNGTRYTFTWQEGRQLASAVVGSNTYTYKYDHNGIRIEKTASGLRHEYILDGMQIDRELVYDIAGNYLKHDISYYYNATGTISSVLLHSYSSATDTTGTTYYLLCRTNIQGDVVAVCSEQGRDLVTFEYDAWGNFVQTKYGTTEIYDMAQLVPFRYRGYYYDAETNLYYLNSRYYDAKVGRFINADGYLNANGDLEGFNMYAYCSNNPVMYTDPTGESIDIALFGFLAKAAAALSAAAPVVGVIIATVAVAAIAAIVIMEIVESTESAEEEQASGYSVYVKRNSESKKVEYVGMTRNPIDREKAHRRDPSKKGLDPLEIKITNLSKQEARVAENALICAYGLNNLRNARREIAAKNVSGFVSEIKSLTKMIFSLPESELLDLMGK